MLTFYNMLKDAFGQAAKAIIGALSKDTSLSKVKDSNKRIEEVRSGLTELVPTHGNPFLKSTEGSRVVIERKLTDPFFESGVLEDYSSKYLLLRGRYEPELLKKIARTEAKEKFLDSIFSFHERLRLSVIR